MFASATINDTDQEFSEIFIIIFLYMTHLIKISCMLANYIVGKTAKYNQKLVFAHYQILYEMGTGIRL